MSFLSRFRVLPKILAVILLLAAAATAISIIGVTSMKSLMEAAKGTEEAGEKGLTASQSNLNLLAMNRAEYRMAADSSPEARKESRERIDREWKQFQERFEKIKKLATTDVDRAYVAEMQPLIANYQREFEGTLAAIAKAGASPSAEEQAKVVAEASTSRLAQEKARDRTRLYYQAQGKETERLAALTEATYNSSTNTIMIVAGVGIVGSLALGFFIGQFGVARPIGASVATLQELAKGNYDVAIEGAERRDEVGDVAKAAQVFKENGLEKLRMQREQEEAEKRAVAQRKTDMNNLADSFEKAVGGIIETVSSASTELEAAAGTLTKTAETTQSLSATVAAASEEASANVQSVASATNEMASSVTEISRQVQESAKIANEAVKQAEKTDGRINELSQAANRIGDVVKLITAIAEQTNLLALNATIEAARAGEAGKGFAVVAQEVKALAAQTGKATGEISSQISGMQSATQESVAAIKEIGGTINRIAEIASSIAAAIEEQGAATSEIARNVQQASQGTTQVASNITEVNRGAGETGSASSQVLSSAQSLAGESNRLKAEVQKFLGTVRAA